MSGRSRRIKNEECTRHQEEALPALEATDAFGLSPVGWNLLHVRHAEFGEVGAQHEIERSILGKAPWLF